MALLSTVMFALPAGATGFVFPIHNQDGFINDDPPPVTASSWIVYDELTDTVLAEHNADTPRPMASITKS
jgi:D-alanyl-D-alanine carboxypeptidase